MGRQSKETGPWTSFSFATDVFFSSSVSSTDHDRELWVNQKDNSFALARWTCFMQFLAPFLSLSLSHSELQACRIWSARTINHFPTGPQPATLQTPVRHNCGALVIMVICAKHLSFFAKRGRGREDEEEEKEEKALLADVLCRPWSWTRKGCKYRTDKRAMKMWSVSFFFCFNLKAALFYPSSIVAVCGPTSCADREKSV